MSRAAIIYEACENARFSEEAAKVGSIHAKGVFLVGMVHFYQLGRPPA